MLGAYRKRTGRRLRHGADGFGDAAQDRRLEVDEGPTLSPLKLEVLEVMPSGSVMGAVLTLADGTRRVVDFKGCGRLQILLSLRKPKGTRSTILSPDATVLHTSCWAAPASREHRATAQSAGNRSGCVLRKRFALRTVGWCLEKGSN